MKKGIELGQKLLEKFYPIVVYQHEVQEAYTNLSEATGYWHLPDVDWLFHKLTGCDPLQQGARAVGQKFGDRVKGMSGPYGKAYTKALLIKEKWV